MFFSHHKECRPLPALVGNNRAHVGGVGCELVITYQETGLLRLRVPVRGGSPPRGRRSKQFDPFPPGWGPGGGASNFGPLPSLVGTGTEKINLRLWEASKKSPLRKHPMRGPPLRGQHYIFEAPVSYQQTVSAGSFLFREMQRYTNTGRVEHIDNLQSV